MEIAHIYDRRDPSIRRSTYKILHNYQNEVTYYYYVYKLMYAIVS